MNRYFLYFIVLGLFWGLSPSLYRAMAVEAVPVSHVIAYSGLGVGAALAAVGWAVNRRLNFGAGVLRYGFICAALMNVPFAMSLFYSHHVPPTELALIMSTAPFFNYGVALLTGRESAAPRKLVAMAVGFVSSAILILSRDGMLAGHMSWWMLAAFSGPIMYTAYNWYAARHWPEGADTMSVGAAESTWSGLMAMPFLLVLAPPWSPDIPALPAYWSVLAATLMWIAERIAFFTLIRDKGAVYTIQAVYVATPAAVIFAALFFGGGSDAWLWVSLAVLMLALWLNNSEKPRPATA